MHVDPSQTLATVDATVDATTTHTQTPTLVAGASIEAGTRIGRYVATSRLGAGAMGVVIGAHDPELDRKLALKLLPTRAREQAAARRRLEREARALAKLEHPNVVAIYDVGVHEGQLFVAMECVDGWTLRAWLDEVERPRPWTEVLAVFRQAGLGLAAAHGVGLVHRDFKPANVMLGRDGRVRVMDFGLARVELGVELEATGAGFELAETLADPDSGGEGLTQAGALIGTPAYMAPEQLARKQADARSDQFGFCVALYEALYGVRPFAAASLYATFEAIQQQRFEPGMAGVRVPGWVRRALVRGLASAPDQRYPSMDALLDALADDPRIRWRKRGVGLAVVSALGLGAWGTFAPTPVAAPVAEPCADMAAKLEGVWDETRRAELRAAFERASEASYVAATLERVEARLDRYASAWVEARAEACLATERGEQSEALLDLRMACLDRRATYLEAAVDVLREADAAVVVRAVEVVEGLPSLDRCADVEALLAEQPPPDDEDDAAAVEALDERLVAAETVGVAGKYVRALAAVDAIVVEVEALGYAPLQVRAHLLQARLQGRSGKRELAAASFERAYFEALAANMSEQGASAASHLVRLYGAALEQPERGRAWAPHAEALLTASGPDKSRASLLNNLGLVALAERDYATAQAHFERSLAAKLERSDEQGELGLTPPLHNLAEIAAKRGDWDAAEASDRRVCAIVERELGPEHPALMPCSMGLGEVAAARGDLETARRHYERAIAVTRALSPRHERLRGPLLALGTLLLDHGDPAGALAPLEQALEVAEAIEKGAGQRANIRFALARALVAGADRDPSSLARARALASEARPDLDEAEREALDAWLAAEDLDAADPEP